MSAGEERRPDRWPQGEGPSVLTAAYQTQIDRQATACAAIEQASERLILKLGRPASPEPGQATA